MCCSSSFSGSACRRRSYGHGWVWVCSSGVWVALMSPHKLTWGFSSAPIGQIVGLTTLAGIMFFQRDTRPLPWRSPVVLMLALWGWTAVTTVFAIYPEEAWNRLGEISAMLLFMFLSMMLFQNLRRLKYLIYVLVGGLAFYGAKGAIFSLLGGAKYIVYGPRSPIFTDNNHLALALNMVLPLLIFLARNEPGRHARWAWGGHRRIHHSGDPVHLFARRARPGSPW